MLINNRYFFNGGMYYRCVGKTDSGDFIFKHTIGRSAKFDVVGNSNIRVYLSDLEMIKKEQVSRKALELISSNKHDFSKKEGTEKCPSQKRMFKKWIDADNCLVKLLGKGMEVCRVYLCPKCSHWHLTSQGYSPKLKNQILKFNTSAHPDLKLNQ